MRFVSSSLVIFAAALVVAASPSTDHPSLNPPPSAIRPELAAAPKASPLSPVPVPLTNAKRLAAGLPPLAPRSRHRNRAPHGGTKVGSARRSVESSLPPINAKCNILAKSGENVKGFLSPSWNSFSQYHAFQSKPKGALEVSFLYSQNSPSPVSLLAKNGPAPAYPYLGAAVGFGSSGENLGAGNPNYATLVGTTDLPAGSPASFETNNSYSATSGTPAGAETSIWLYDPITQAITPQWINTDGSPVEVIVFYSVQAQNGLLSLTGDLAAFKETYGVDVEPLTFSCVTPVTVDTPV